MTRAANWWTPPCCAPRASPRKKFPAAVFAAGSIRSSMPPSKLDRATPPGCLHRRAGRQLHRSRGHRHLSAAAHLWRAIRDRAAERAGRSDRAPSGSSGWRKAGSFPRRCSTSTASNSRRRTSSSSPRRDLLDAGRAGGACATGWRANFRTPKCSRSPCATGRGSRNGLPALETSEQAARRAMEVDYEIYAEGEALLGWLNATVQLDGGAGRSTPTPCCKRLAARHPGRASAERGDRAFEDDASAPTAASATSP